MLISLNVEALMNKNLSADYEFTTKEYRSLLKLAKYSYNFVSYRELPIGNGCIIWRHDVDMSLNRAVRLAEIEFEEGVSSTFFLYLHSEFYNIMEKGQLCLIKRLLQLGSKIGLHFNPKFYNIDCEVTLSYWIKKEANFLEDLLGVDISEFSFHDTNDFILSCEADEYGGLTNCYSKYFKEEVPYCSDSNGIWAHRKLRDVLSAAVDSRLQVLTHPEWWQEEKMEPRERVSRCSFGRAENTLSGYIDGIAACGRSDNYNIGQQFIILESISKKRGKSLEILWLRGERIAVYLDLWRILEATIAESCTRWIGQEIGTANAELKMLTESQKFKSVHHHFLSIIFDEISNDLIFKDRVCYSKWRALRDDLVYGAQINDDCEIEEGVAFVIGVIHRLVECTLIYRQRRDKYRLAITAGVYGQSSREVFLAWLDRYSITLGVDVEKYIIGPWNE